MLGASDGKADVVPQLSAAFAKALYKAGSFHRAGPPVLPARFGFPTEAVAGNNAGTSLLGFFLENTSTAWRQGIRGRRRDF